MTDYCPNCGEKDDPVIGLIHLPGCQITQPVPSAAPEGEPIATRDRPIVCPTCNSAKVSDVLSTHRHHCMECSGPDWPMSQAVTDSLPAPYRTATRDGEIK